jgi:hypothetical protein
VFVSDLSDCQLMQIPDAIYFMMKDTTLTACNLSSNVITKIPPKFPAKFSLITGEKFNRIKTVLGRKNIVGLNTDHSIIWK